MFEEIKAFGREIKIARIRKGMNQKELAAQLGISRQQLSEIENGHRVPSQNQIDAIDNVLEFLNH